MTSRITANPVEYQTNQPFPYLVQDGFLDEPRATALQQEILSLPADRWDRYDNPFEQKFTLRDKYAFPEQLASLFEEWTSPEWVAQVGALVGHDLVLDTTRNFWGVHTYGPGDRLDIHVDAGLHPTLGLKKQVTVGLYLSHQWKEEYGCALEVWKGSSCCAPTPALLERTDRIAPLFNRLVLFTCNDVAWHGNPEPATCPADSKRIFLTISYLSVSTADENKRMKALFIKRPEDPEDPEKDRLRLLRADPERYKEVYRL